MMVEEQIKMTVVGMGVTGLSCARYFSARHIPFRVVDSRENPPMRKKFDEEFPLIEKQCGDFLDNPFDSHDVLVVSPGVSLEEPGIIAALKKGAKLTSDIEIFLQQIDAPVIGITGSNGKSTVTTLVGEILKAADKNTCVAGNIGMPALEQLLEPYSFDVYVLELSSFQLERLSDDVGLTTATILNISEDHMDRYDSLNTYMEAKRRIFVHAKHVVYNRDDLNTLPGKSDYETVTSFGFSTPSEKEFGIVISDGQEWIAYGAEKLFPVSDLKIKGRHNVANAMAAMALCRSIGIAWAPMAETLKVFKGLPHRCEWVASVGDVQFYNDSKATNVGAAVAAIGGFNITEGRLLLIAGGLDKDSDFIPLAKVVREKVFHVFLIGKDAIKLEAAIGSDMCTYSEDMFSAVKAANDMAKAGDVVLLAPACASFDMFMNYEDRGNRFMEAVRGLSR